MDAPLTRTREARKYYTQQQFQNRFSLQNSGIKQVNDPSLQNTSRARALSLNVSRQGAAWPELHVIIIVYYRASLQVDCRCLAVSENKEITWMIYFTMHQESFLVKTSTNSWCDGNARASTTYGAMCWYPVHAAITNYCRDSWWCDSYVVHLFFMVMITGYPRNYYTSSAGFRSK